MIIVLVRHAVAEESSAEKKDRYRNLTASGRNDFQSSAEGLSLLFSGKSYVITSPFTRAQQTADILANYLEDAEIHLCDELASPDLNSFIEKCIPKAGVIFAVGHEPFLSTWLNTLTGKNQHFKKSSAAVVEIKNNHQHRFILYSNSDSFLRLNNKDFPFEQFRELLELRSQMLHENCVEDTIHQLRVTIRQLKIILYNTNPLLPQENLTEVLSELDYLFDCTDKVRDYDVLTNFIKNSGSSFKELLELIDKLKEEKLSELLTVIQKERITLALLKLFQLLLQLNDLEGCRKTVKNRFLSLTSKTKKFITNIDINDQLVLHKLRIRCKKIYYSAEIFPFVEKFCGHKIIKQAKLLKDILGLNHDFFIIQLLLENSVNYENPIIQLQSKQILTQLQKKDFKTDELKYLINNFKESL